MCVGGVCRESLIIILDLLQNFYGETDMLDESNTAWHLTKFHLYQNCNCQESLDYPVLEKTGHLVSDKCVCGKGDMLSVQVKFLNLMKGDPYPLFLSESMCPYKQVCT